MAPAIATYEPRAPSRTVLLARLGRCLRGRGGSSGGVRSPPKFATAPFPVRLLREPRSRRCKLEIGASVERVCETEGVVFRQQEIYA